MAKLVRKGILYQDFMSVPDNMVAEILNGTLVTQPRPTPRHSRVISVLGFKLGNAFDKEGDGGGPRIAFTQKARSLMRTGIIPSFISKEHVCE